MAVNQPICDICVAEILDESQWDLTILSAAERQRLEEARSLEKRCQFVTGRTLLRKALGRFLGLSCSEVTIGIGENGKPFCCNDRAPYFSLTHSRNLVGLALCKEKVGIDIEHHREGRDITGIASTFFSPAELETFNRQEDAGLRLDAFYTHWVTQEAASKITANGIFWELGNANPEQDSQGAALQSFSARIRANCWLGVAAQSDTALEIRIKHCRLAEDLPAPGN
ncbi:MAG: 4'-phosphopantetheinyl transferase superfamily protein [Gammaproteobacteria bacterium]|nr:4'-phosphopantetheinyl transferase superfamily protein [Gammaproteobacteria bacterium]